MRLKGTNYPFGYRFDDDQDKDRVDKSLSADLQLFDFAVERRETDIQKPGCLFAVLIGLVQGAHNVLFFEVSQCIPEIECEGGIGLTTGDDRARQILQHDSVAFGENHRMLDDVVELAYVAFPLQRHENADRGLVDTLKVPFELGVVTLDEMFDQLGNIFRPLPKRRNMDFHDIETIVEIFTKATRFHFVI